MAHRVEIDGKDKGAASHAGSRKGRLAPGMPRTDNDYVVAFHHSFESPVRVVKKFIQSIDKILFGFPVRCYDNIELKMGKAFPALYRILIRCSRRKRNSFTRDCNDFPSPGP